MLAGLAGVWAAVFAAHSLAFRAQSPLLGLLPPIALVGFADSVLEDVVRPVFGLLFLVAATALLFADGLRRVYGWGPVWTAPGRAARVDVAAGRGARRVAAAAVTVAALAPIVLPGFGSQGLIDVSTAGDDLVRIDPLVSVQASLQRDETATVFEVEADVGRYWRMVALPNYDGRDWRPDPSPPTLPITAGTTLETTTPVASPAETTEVRFTTTSELALPWLPLPYPPVSTDAPLEGMRWDPVSGSVALEEGIGPGVRYTATAQVVQPTPAQLRAEVLAATDATLPFTQVPDDPSVTEIEALARTWTQGAATPYDQVIAIQDRFTDGAFTYDAEVAGSSSDRAMVEFLTQTKRGFCQQFSSAMAVMLRTLGIPARLAVGFTPGEFDGSADRLTVTTENAHSWVEVFFPSFGWVPFEPTPDRQNVLAYPYLDPDGPQACFNADGSRCEPTRRGGAANAVNDLSNPAFLTAADREAARPGGLGSAGIDGPAGLAAASGAADASPDADLLTGRVIVVAALLALGALVLVAPARAWRRRRRLRRAGTAPRRLILATYDVFIDRAADLGRGKPAGQTLEEYRRTVTSSGSGGAGDLDRLTRLTTDAAYAAREPGHEEVVDATRASRGALRAMRRETGWAQRLTGPYRRR
jgi:transglutaminase-like putative cysteine protease